MAVEPGTIKLLLLDESSSVDRHGNASYTTSRQEHQKTEKYTYFDVAYLLVFRMSCKYLTMESRVSALLTRSSCTYMMMFFPESKGSSSPSAV